MLSMEAPPILEQAMAIYRELGDRAGIAKSLWARSEYDFCCSPSCSRGFGRLSSVLLFNSLLVSSRFSLSHICNALDLDEELLEET